MYRACLDQLWLRSDCWLHSAITVDQNQDWSRSWT